MLSTALVSTTWLTVELDVFIKGDSADTVTF